MLSIDTRNTIQRLLCSLLLGGSILLCGCEGETNNAAVADADGQSVAGSESESAPGEGEVPADAAGGKLAPHDSDSSKAPNAPPGDDVFKKNPFANEPPYVPPQGGAPPINGNSTAGAAGVQNPGFPAAGGFNGGTPNAPTGTRPAGVGVGKKGRSFDNETGVARMIVQPAVSFYATREKLVFKNQIPQALSLYKATNGFYPKSHQDFMTHIVKANRIVLPELQPGHRYVYDPKTAQLMVEFPQQTNGR